MAWFKKEQQEEKDLYCPRDGKKMRKKRIQDVVIDICPHCKGMWLDDQEIEKLVMHAKTMKGGKNNGTTKKC